MEKFCGNCGNQVEEGAKVCGNCGTPVVNDDGKMSVSDVPGISYVDPEKKAKNKKRAKLVLGAGALVIVLVIAFNIISGFVGYKGAVRKVMNAYKDYNVDALVDMSSDLYLFYGDDSYIEYYFEESVSNDLEDFEDRVGHKYKISYEITEAYTVSDRKFNELIDSLSYYEDFDTDIISKIMVVEIEVTAKEGKKTSTKSKELYLTKESGAWKLLYLYD